MLGFFVIAISLLVLTFFVVRVIAKLPSRYERSPKDISPWNALDQGIDPTANENPQP